MIVKGIALHRAKSIKKKLEKADTIYPTYDRPGITPVQRRYVENLRGIYATRMFGLCWYRNYELI
mgnify:CR=1 FL=1